MIDINTQLTIYYPFVYTLAPRCLNITFTVYFIISHDCVTFFLYFVLEMVHVFRCKVSCIMVLFIYWSLINDFITFMRCQCVIMYYKNLLLRVKNLKQNLNCSCQYLN